MEAGERAKLLSFINKLLENGKSLYDSSVGPEGEMGYGVDDFQAFSKIMASCKLIYSKAPKELEPWKKDLTGEHDPTTAKLSHILGVLEAVKDAIESELI